MHRLPDHAAGLEELEVEALLRLSGARDLLEYVLAGQVLRPEPWVGGARRLIEKAEKLLEAAA